MVLQNQEYVRQQAGNGRSRPPLLSPSTLVRLIVATVFVYVLQIAFASSGSSPVTRWLQLTSEDLYQRGQFWRLLTYAFVHDRQMILHLVFNMVTLYSVGRMLVRLLGDREFLWFYLTSAVFAGMCSVIFYTLAGQSPAIIGASGAVYAVFCAVAVHYPRQKVMLFGAIAIELRWLLAAFVAVDAVPMLTGMSGSTQVAHSAHLGGLVFGYLYVSWAMNLTRAWDHFAGRLTKKKPNRNLRIFAPTATPESNLSEQMDLILAKISSEGEASLTARERNILTQASRQLRKGQATRGAGEQGGNPTSLRLD